MGRLTDVGYTPERVVANMTVEQMAAIYKKLCQYENTCLEPEEVLSGLELVQIACMQAEYKVMKEKQTPKEVITTIWPEDIKIGAVTFKAGTKVEKCPACSEWITPTMKYCASCGQKLQMK